LDVTQEVMVQGMMPLHHTGANPVFFPIFSFPEQGF
jgi:hypothetical protein